jgi:phage protein D
MTPSADDIGVAGFDIRVAGSDVGDLVLDAVSEIVVDARLRVPDRLALRLSDDDQSIVDAGTFAVGTAITVSLSGDDDAQTSVVFDGQVSALAPYFDTTTATLTVLALDRGCLLQRAPATASYQNMSYGDIATKLGSGAGLGVGTIAGGLTLPFVQQSNETPWDFLWRLALEVDFEVKVTGSKLNFRPAGGPAGGAPVTLTLGENLRSFAPRVTAVQQIDSVEVRGWDPVAAKALTATATPGATDSKPGVSRADVADALGAGSEIVVDHPLIDQQHASTVAKSVAAQIANAFVEGEGTADGNPALLPGSKLTLDGIGATFGGTYAVSGVRHVMRSYATYETQFSISGREDRSLLGLAASRASAQDGWARRIVVAVVTNNDDPDKLGRVRVRYPALADDHEGWWARVLAPGAGGARGLLSLPEVGDEVLVAFEHESEQHPYVLGSVFNGQALPGALSRVDGSFGLFSDKELIVTAVDKIAMTGAKELTLTAGGDATLTTKGAGQGAPGNVEVSSKANLALSADQSASLEATTTLDVTSKTAMTLDAGTTLEVSGKGMVTIKAASIKLEATAMVQVSAPQVMLG